MGQSCVDYANHQPPVRRRAVQHYTAPPAQSDAVAGRRRGAARRRALLRVDGGLHGAADIVIETQLTRGVQHVHRHDGPLSARRLNEICKFIIAQVRKPVNSLSCHYYYLTSAWALSGSISIY